MVEIYSHNLWNRAKWQQERDAARVSAGACARVSIAAELDRFHAELARPFCANSIAAARRLDERIKLYLEAVQTRHPAWAQRVTAQVAGRIRIVVEELEKIARAKDEYNKAATLVRNSYDAAETDIEDWLASGGDTRLGSRHVAMLVAGLRDVHLCGQRLIYITDKIDRTVTSDARRYWSTMDSRRPPDRSWLEGVSDLRLRLRPI